MDISVNNGSLTMALGPFGITLNLQIEKLRLSGHLTGPRARSFEQEQHWKWGVQTPHLMLLVLTKLSEAPQLALACWPVGSLHFLSLQPPSSAPRLSLSNPVCVED